MTSDEALALLRLKTNNMLQVQPVSLGSHLISLVCAVSRPPQSAVAPDGYARFQVRLDREAWRALQVLVDEQYALHEKFRGRTQ